MAIDQETDLPLRNEQGFFIKVKKGEIGLLISEISTHFPLDGYTDKTETEKRILKNGFETGDRWLNTGDLMRDLGFRHTQFIDRVGDSYRWHGENVSSQEVENILMEYPSIEQAVVYGIEIPNHDGRAGMASMQIHQDNQFRPHERRQLAYYLQSQLPSYAIPRFLRITPSLDTTATFKFKKRTLKKQSYHQAETEDPIYIFNQAQQTYDLLTQETESLVDQGLIRL